MLSLSDSANGASSGRASLNLEIRSAGAGDGPVIYKCDGSRFNAGKTEFTLKLCAGESYVLSLNDSSGSCTFMGCKLFVGAEGAEQELPLQVPVPSISVAEQGAGQEANLNAAAPDGMTVNGSTQPAPPACSLTRSWMCSLPPSTKGLRSQLALLIETQELGQVRLPVLLKVYKPDDKARLNGSKLRMVQFSVAPDPQLDRWARVVGTAFFALPG